MPKRSTYIKKDEMSDAPQVEELLKNLEFHRAMQDITGRINGAPTLREILIDIKEDIRRLFNIYLLNIYVIDKETKELYTLQGIGAETKEIRFPIDDTTFAGFVAQKKKTLHIADAYNDREIKKIHSALRFDDSLDELSGNTTSQILAAPIIHDGIILGILEIMNIKNGETIDDYSQIFLDEIEVCLARALFMHLDFTVAGQKFSAKLEKLIHDGVISIEQMDQALKESFLTKVDLAAVLIDRFNVPKQTVGDALADYYDCPFTAYSDDLHVVQGLLTGIKKSTLVNGLWIPLKIFKGKIHVLIDDPFNQEKRREIEKDLETSFIEYEVALADDILKLIERAYSEQEDDAQKRRKFSQIPQVNRPAPDIIAPPYFEKARTTPQVQIDPPREKTTISQPATRTRPVKTIVEVEETEAFPFTESEPAPPAQPAAPEAKPLPKSSTVITDETFTLQDIPQSIHITDIPEKPVIAVTKQEGSILPALTSIIFDAFARNASDIHFEPDSKQNKAALRFRMDGQCFARQPVELSEYKKIIDEIKTIAAFDPKNHSSIQEGNLNIKRPSGEEVHLRITLIPTRDGVEDAIFHFIPRAKLVALELLGLSEHNYTSLVNILQQPRGVILVVGPAHADLTSTLHACLKSINTPDKKIWTAEDTLDIVQNGLRQVLIDPKKGLDYPRVLRTFSNADPDVIMAGQIHDPETARLCMEASLKGRLVLSTLQADNIPDAIEKCLDTGLSPLVFADGMLAMMEQRTIKTLCPKCKGKYHPSQEEYDELAQIYGKEAFDKLNIPYSNNISLYRPMGCDSCNQTGYTGRCCVSEIFIFTPQIKRMIRRKESVESIYRTALAGGTTTLLQDGLFRVLQGQSDYRHVRLTCLR